MNVRDIADWLNESLANSAAGALKHYPNDLAGRNAYEVGYLRSAIEHAVKELRAVDLDAEDDGEDRPYDPDLARDYRQADEAGAL